MAKNGTTKGLSPETGARNKQRFTFSAPTARTVLLVGDFTAWQRHPITLEKRNDGSWQAEIQLPPGTHHYRFLVDGQWRDDPQCATRVANAFGSQNCVCQVR